MLPAAFPAPRTAPLRGGPIAGWGIIGPGWIAGEWADAVRSNTEQRLVAVGSSSLDRARAFAAEHGVERAYGDYRALVADPEVDVVYIASRNEAHAEHALLAIEAGKHVLVEKPLATGAAEARRIAEAAAAAGVYALEAMWTRFLPQTDVILQLVADGVLGELGMVTAEFSQPFDRAANARIFAPTVGGGGLLDIGVYPLHWVRMLLGPGRTEAVVGARTPEGVDARAVIVQAHDGGARSVASCAIDLDSPWSTVVSGTRAAIQLPWRFFTPGGFDLIADGERRSYADPNGLRMHQGLCYEAAAVAADIEAGRSESALHPLAASIAVLELIDEARRRLGAITPEP